MRAWDMGQEERERERERICKRNCRLSFALNGGRGE